MDLTSSLMEALSGTAKYKRIEQLKRWEESETNKEPSQLKERSKKINFSDGCVFLAACAAGEKDEVERLIAKGADIDTANVDGLTALHQSCIDDNLEMVEFLVESGADINCGDNEGWTPLHATASCGFLSIARYLIEHGANVAAINNDGELPIDIAESDDMEELLQEEINRQGIDCEAARNEEERRMLDDANQWLNSGTYLDRPHPKTGATALHVASAKGYIKVMSALVQAGANVNAQDVDGWTPLHAAAHWGQKEACEFLAENLSDMDIKNLVGQTPCDLAEPEMVKLLEELRKKQVSLQKDKFQSQVILDTKSTIANRRMVAGCDKTSRPVLETKVSPKEKEMSESSSDGSETESESKEIANEKSEVEKQNKVNKTEESKVILRKEAVPAKPDEQVRLREPKQPPPQPVSENEDNIPSWRRGVRKTESAPTPMATVPVTSNVTKVIDTTPVPPTTGNNEETVSERRRPASIETSDKYSKFGSFVRPSRFNRPNSLPPNMTAVNSGRLLDNGSNLTSRRREPTAVPSITPPTSRPSSTESQLSTSRLSSEESSGGDGTSQPATPSQPASGAQVRRSFVPPVRDEESETQRKAHAKRVRETRRSTQGVTLEVVKSAEQLIKQQQQESEAAKTPADTITASTTTKSEQQPSSSSTTTTTTTPITTTGTTTTGTTTTSTTTTERRRAPVKDDDRPAVPPTSGDVMERRSSWRLRLEKDNAKATDDSRVTLRRSRDAVDASVTDFALSPTTYSRRSRLSATENEGCNNGLVSTAVGTVRTRNSVTRMEDEPTEQDKENESGPNSIGASNVQTTQAVIQRRRRPKRRSTGVVYPDADDNDGGETKEEENKTDRKSVSVEGTNVQNALERGYRSRIGSAGSLVDGTSRSETPSSRYSDRLSRTSSATSTTGLGNEDKEEKDYKKLYEDVKVDYDRLVEKNRKTETELQEAKLQLEKAQNFHRNSASDAEKRERRALERKLSEMEEEVKHMNKLKLENEKLKAENMALTRVVSKLTNK